MPHQEMHGIVAFSISHIDVYYVFGGL